MIKQTDQKRESKFSPLELLPLPIISPVVSLLRYRSGKTNVYDKDLRGVSEDVALMGVASHAVFTYAPVLFGIFALADHYGRTI